MIKTDRVYSKEWICKYGCGYEYISALPITGQAHFCPKKNGQHVDSIPRKDLSDSACIPPKKRVASSGSTTPQKSEEDTGMATNRAEPKVPTNKATKATKAKAAPAEATVNVEKKGRRNMGGRGWLANEVETILRKRPADTVTVGEIVKAITNPEGEHPSTGAVAAVILRWGEAGYVKVKNERPMSFNGYQAKWKDSNLDAFLEAEKAKRAKARAAAKV